ncbi:hypothetical protein LUZ61_020482 [Rhynchospora tenuis]|uniref:DUF632 domain-containing protein n=1 Tax=Rhynchospora tenuis TaxID=198213 RepID=A0AAD5ZD40_9POAL|nr:hypothetical protein LUZ61_020482 [Rhynchospora tenuis]
MGCTVSRPEDQTTVKHCRDRCRHISEAIQYRYSMAEAHAAYALSLRSLASSLHAFLLPSVSNNVPPVQSNRDMPSGRPHIQFNSARSESSHVRHADVVINHSKHHPKPPSVSFEQPPESPDPPPVVQNYNLPPYQDPRPSEQNPNFAPYSYPSMDYGMSSIRSFFPFSTTPNTSKRMPGSSAAQPKEPIMPPTIDPPSPDESAWDFLNPFGSYDRYYENYMPNTSFRKVREEEGIPELEEVKDETENVASAPSSKRVEKEKEEEHVDHKLKSVDARGSGVGERSVRISFEKKVHSKEMEKEVEEEPVRTPRVFHDDSQIVLEIKEQFERVAGAVDAVAALLEAGKRHYHFKDSIRKVVGRFCCRLPAIPNSIDDESNYEEFNAMRNNNSLSITLQKLYMWETKLLEEVQNEETLRAEYQRKCNDVSSPLNRGFDQEKIEEMQSPIRIISTRIRITLQVLHSISNKICEIRDKELWPQICELVQELMTMWEIMLECHQAQLQAISQAKALDSIFFSGTNYNHSNMESTKQLQLDLQSCVTSFVAWIHTQRNFFQSLNSWLMTALNYEPEITEDGPAPFSPGRLGLSPVFIISNNWVDIIAKISEVNAVEAMESLYNGVLQFREKQKLEQHQMFTANNDQKGIRTMEREERLLLKQLKAQKLKFKSTSSQNYVYSSRIEMGSVSDTENNSLKSNLRRIFESLEGFASANAREYEELHMHSEDESSFVN